MATQNMPLIYQTNFALCSLLNVNATLLLFLRAWHFLLHIWELPYYVRISESIIFLSRTDVHSFLQRLFVSNKMTFFISPQSVIIGNHAKPYFFYKQKTSKYAFLLWLLYRTKHNNSQKPVRFYINIVW